MVSSKLIWGVILAVIQGIDRYYRQKTGRSLVKQEELGNLIQLSEGKIVDAQKDADKAHSEAETHADEVERLKKELADLRNRR